jgi:hypothetical protein
MTKLIYWLGFLVSTAVMIWLLAFHPQWFWVMLPFVGAFLVKALDVI